MLYPFIFHPIFKERVWGGRKLEQLFNKPLPPGLPIGESWEISDRAGDTSVIANGPLAGKDLHWLVVNHPKELVGKVRLQEGRFPLLVKILDAHEKLSLQVHPPPKMAAKLGGEPKTELWYIVDAALQAELYVGLKRDVTRAEFERHIEAGTVQDVVHRVHVERDDAMFLPSGRVHAIGAGLVLFEIQQNSDTTYRVFDWNRLGLDGKPRPLQPDESLASIDFEDFEPPLAGRDYQTDNHLKSRALINDPLFSAKILRVEMKESLQLPQNKMNILGLIEGGVVIRSKVLSVPLEKGQFCLIPAGISAEVLIEPKSSFVLVEAGD